MAKRDLRVKEDILICLILCFSVKEETTVLKMCKLVMGSGRTVVYSGVKKWQVKCSAITNSP